MCIDLSLLKNFVTILLLSCGASLAEVPPVSDYCARLQQEIQGKKHGFLAGNVTYYVGGFHASWDQKESETLGLTHPFHHDLRSRGVGLKQSHAARHDDTGLGNDFSGWEFYKDTHVLYGSVIVGDRTYPHPVPRRMVWRPDRMICEYEMDGIRLREEKFIASNDAACSIITAAQPVTLRFVGQSFFGRHSVTSTATGQYVAERNAIHLVEGGTTKCQPETDRSEQIGPIMYQGMSTVIAASRDFATNHRFTTGEQGQVEYEFEVPCDSQGVVLVWAMDDEYQRAISHATELLGKQVQQTSETVSDSQAPHSFQHQAAREALLAKTHEMNRQLNEQIPWFRCSDRKFEDVYYYLWSLYLMYYVDVQRGWEMEPHTQTAVNNFLGMHRYDATFQIDVGAWTGDKSHYAYGNVLTWKHLFESGQYRRSQNGVIALPDNKGTTWHSGVYGNELSEHVLGAWKIYQHTGDVGFLRDCYEGYFREVFQGRIAPFFSNQFEVAAVLIAMARLTGHVEDVDQWQRLVPLEAGQVRAWFDQRWQANGHKNFFAGPKSGMLMTTGFWHLRSKYFPREYATKMVESWAIDNEKGFYGEIFPLAMSRQAMNQFASKVDHSFGYTPDTAYFVLSGLFRQRLGDPAWQLALNHLENYNFNSEWGLPVAPEAYTRDGKLFGDQYSNFNAGKILLYLEGFAGLEYSIPERRLVVHDTMPKVWEWMEVRLPIQMPGEQDVSWPVIRYERSSSNGETVKTVRVTDCPLQVTVEPWTEGKQIIRAEAPPAGMVGPTVSRFPDYTTYRFEDGVPTAEVRLQLRPISNDE
ncbi:MAG: hypothetical protein P8L85_03800 [Rubripirellula sp.]|nr:hypothetical protein [Rubripirellula sp.]